MPNPNTNRRIIKTADVALDPDVLDWITRVQGQGSDVTISGTRTAVNAFVIGLKADGVWDKIVRLNIYAGDGLAALKAPLKNLTGTTNDVLTNFVGGDYSQSIGLTGDGTTKYVQPGVPFDQGGIGQTSYHSGVYVRTPETVGALSIALGGSNSDSTQETLMGICTLGSTFDCWNFTAGQGRISVADSIAFGFYVGTRTASNAFALYRNGSSIVTGATSGSSSPSLACYVHARNLNGTPDFFFRQPLELYTFGVGLTATDASNYSARYSTLRTSLGR
jgi:hypothetical protein